jgi:hypothetical protein
MISIRALPLTSAMDTLTPLEKDISTPFNNPIAELETVSPTGAGGATTVGEHSRTMETGTNDAEPVT